MVIVVVMVSGGRESDEKEERESKERSHVESGYCEFNGFVHGCDFILYSKCVCLVVMEYYVLTLWPII